MNINKMHGKQKSSILVGVQGAGEFMGKATKNGFSGGNPLTSVGKKVMSNMKKQYGAKKAKNVFYASINSKKSGSGAWHK